MKHIVTKKILPLLALMMIAMTSLCSAESWQLVAKEVGSDREYYADSGSSWYDGVVKNIFQSCPVWATRMKTT